jgi:hypothetical protein
MATNGLSGMNSCDYYGQVGCGNLHANGHPSSGPWRQWHCVKCGAYFLETHGTLLYGKHVSPDLLVWAVGALAEGLGIRAVARVFEVDPNTVLARTVRSARPRLLGACRARRLGSGWRLIP